MSQIERPHRTLRLVSPPQKGTDVEALQAALNKEFSHRKLNWREVKADGVFGAHTLRACAFLGWVLGFSGRRVDAILGHAKGGPHVSKKVQQLLRNPQQRSILDHTREKARKSKVAKLRHTHYTGPAVAVGYLLNMAEAGVHETGSTNTGTLVDKWESYFGIHGEPWCGCLAGYAAKAIGKSRATTWFPYGPSIIADANAGRNGIHAVPFDQAQPGDILVYWGGEHVGTCVQRPSGDQIQAVEGNTSPNDGDSQADGGCVARKTRSRSDVTCVARVYG